jgi:hypothetical protein
MQVEQEVAYLNLNNLKIKFLNKFILNYFYCSNKYLLKKK